VVSVAQQAKSLASWRLASAPRRWPDLVTTRRLCPKFDAVQTTVNHRKKLVESSTCDALHVPIQGAALGLVQQGLSPRNTLSVRIATVPKMLIEDQILELDLLALRDHTERAGDTIEPDLHRKRLTELLAISHLCTVRRNEVLAAYAMVHPKTDDYWFVTAFNTHPMHRSPDVFRELLLSFAQMVKDFGIAELKSNVYKTNQLSMSFHRHLGFRVTKENEKGVEFTVTLQELELSPAIRRTRQRVQRRPGVFPLVSA
jgi:hypothetical protein